MRAYTLISTLALSMVAAACATQSDSGPIVDDEDNFTREEAFFEENVKPILSEHCASCHSQTNEFNAPRFLGESPAEYYDMLVANTMFVSCDVENSILLLKGADPNHAGVSLPGSGKPLVAEWLGLEAIERFGGVCNNTAPPPPDPDAPPPDPDAPPPPPAESPMTGQKAMQQFGDCMTLTDWIDTGMDQVANQNSNYNDQNNVKCFSCHDTKLNTVSNKWVATGGNHMPNPNAGNAEEQVMHAFEAMRYMYDSFNLVRWTVDPADGSFTDLVPSQRWRDKGVEGGSHPSYQLEQQYQDSYAAFFQRTYDRWMSGACNDGPPAPDAP